jgi:hypothetical protein
LPPCREYQPEAEPSESLAIIPSFEDDTLVGADFESERVISTSLSNLTI